MTDQTIRMQYADDGQMNYSNWAEGSIEIVDLGSGAVPAPTVLGNLSAANVASVDFVRGAQ